LIVRCQFKCFMHGKIDDINLRITRENFISKRYKLLLTSVIFSRKSVSFLVTIYFGSFRKVLNNMLLPTLSGACRQKLYYIARLIMIINGDLSSQILISDFNCKDFHFTYSGRLFVTSWVYQVWHCLWCLAINEQVSCLYLGDQLNY